MNPNERKVNNFIKKLTSDEDFCQTLWLFYLENSATEEELTKYFNKIVCLERIVNILNNVPPELIEAIYNKINHLSTLEQQVLILYLLGVNVDKICNIFNNIEKSKLIQMMVSYKEQI
jgi:hypothetical protein